MTKPSGITNVFASSLAVVDRLGRSLIAGGIHLYRRFLRTRLRRQCLFEVGCSEFVLHAARTGSTLQAVRAFAARWRSCRGDYSIGSADGVPHALTRCGMPLALQDLVPAVREDVETAYSRARDALSSGR